MENNQTTAHKAMRDRKVFFGKRAKHLYQFLGWAFQNEGDWRFMNYGYAFDDPADNPVLEKRDEGERYSAQLYHVVASQTDLQGKRLLDVGTGRGGGSSYMQRYLKPLKTIGMDLASNAVKICKKNNANIDGLTYQTGDAQDMPFEDGCFEAVTNVESSHCYPDRDKFFSEVFRVLTPGGCFLYTDFTPSKSNAAEELEKWLADLAKAGFVDIKSTNITKNVVKGLELDSDRRIRQINAKFPRGTKRLARLWAGTTDSWIYDDFNTGKREYVIFYGKKPG